MDFLSAPSNFLVWQLAVNSPSPNVWLSSLLVLVAVAVLILLLIIWLLLLLNDYYYHYYYYCYYYYYYYYYCYYEYCYWTYHNITSPASAVKWQVVVLSFVYYVIGECLGGEVAALETLVYIYIYIYYNYYHYHHRYYYASAAKWLHWSFRPRGLWITRSSRLHARWYMVKSSFSSSSSRKGNSTSNSHSHSNNNSNRDSNT